MFLLVEELVCDFDHDHDNNEHQPSILLPEYRGLLHRHNSPHQQEYKGSLMFNHELLYIKYVSGGDNAIRAASVSNVAEPRKANNADRSEELSARSPRRPSIHRRSVE